MVANPILPTPTIPKNNVIPFSLKQKQILSWWAPESPVKDYDGIIADGSIRAGKTYPMGRSFIEWAFHYFDGQAFGLFGKTVGAFHRNVWSWLKPLLLKQGYTVQKIPPPVNGYLISKNGKTNIFYIFGGRDERSQDLIQGITLAGAYFDEVALMPESFVNQATGRCSVEGAKLWFNCNPESPSHWFKLNWLDKAEEKRLLHVHFTMGDNPSLSKRVRERYQGLYTGVFYKRFILGLWVVAQGAIYDMFGDENQYDELNPYRYESADRYIAIDYGTQNAMVFLDILDDGDKVYIDDEYYWSGRTTGQQKTDSQYADDLDRFCQDKGIRQIIIDPSAASFIAELRLRGYRVREADNEVGDGIRLTATLIGKRIIQINRHRCKNLIREIQSYVWDPKPTEKGNEKPLKKDDHGPDALRYFVKTIFKPRRLMRDAA
jgi:PBSX family phage terminase large subunit